MLYIKPNMGKTNKGNKTTTRVITLGYSNKQECFAYLAGR